MRAHRSRVLVHPSAPWPSCRSRCSGMRCRSRWSRLKHVRPPTKKDLGTKVRKLKPIVTTPEVIQELVAETAGLPPEDAAAGIIRLRPGGALKPVKDTSSSTTYKWKLGPLARGGPLLPLPPPRAGADAGVGGGACDPQPGGGAPRAEGEGGVDGRASVPKGKAATRNMPTLTLSHNIVHCEENGTVTFGVTKYPPWVLTAALPLALPSPTVPRRTLT